jgi:hypothetical protein
MVYLYSYFQPDFGTSSCHRPLQFPAIAVLFIGLSGLELLILKAVSLCPQHGYGVLLRIEQISGKLPLNTKLEEIP